MNPRIARWSGWTLVAALVASVVLLIVLGTGRVLVSQRGALGGSLVTAEFRNSWPLVGGMSVRISGAVAGSVQSVDLTDHGTSKVTLRLARGMPAPRADATAAIRQQDVLGDTYVALDLGSDPERLDGTIPTSRTVTMPRLDEVFSTFDEPEREALKATVVTLSRAMDERGESLNRSILQLRPAIRALDDLLAEIDGQQADLAAVTADAERLTAQLAAGAPSIDRGLRALQTLLASTAARDRSLDRALAGAPQAVRDTRRLLRRSGTVAASARPLAGRLRQATPELRRIAPLIEPATGDLRRTITALRPTITKLKATLVAAEPVTGQLKDLDPVDVLLPAARLLEVLSPVFGDGAKALFGADSYGADPVGDVGLGAVATERGDQPLSPNVDPRRMWLRTGIVLSCQTFGRPVQPGCLAEYLHDTGLNVPAAASSGSETQRQGTTTPADERLMEWLMR